MAKRTETQSKTSILPKGTPADPDYERQQLEKYGIKGCTYTTISLAVLLGLLGFTFIKSANALKELAPKSPNN